jgi:hypothetical protein
MTDENTQSTAAAPPRKTLLETSALIVGYAMSRLDDAYLKSRGLSSWKAAFADAAASLDVRPASIKNLRDEFDPVHGNARRGWKDRPMRPNRQLIMGELCGVSDAALLDIVSRILARDAETVEEFVEPLSRPATRMHNVAERLRTGRLAEEFFLDHSEAIANLAKASILDHRDLFRGYDFGLRDRDEIAIEVKGMKRTRGELLFTDREWAEARVRHDNYWLVVIGNMEAKPSARMIRNPAAALKAECRCQTTVAATWRATFEVA